MHIMICIEIEDGSSVTDTILGGTAACAAIFSDYASNGHLRVDEEREVSDLVANDCVGRVSYFRSE